MGRHFDYNAGVPTVEAFIPRPQDDGALSAHLAEHVSAEQAKKNPHDPSDERFGLCELDIVDVSNVTTGAAYVDYWPTQGMFGEYHAPIYGCVDIYVAAQVVSVAKTVFAPRRF